jgi:chromosome segregation ATPase
MSERHLDPVWRALHLRNACGETLSEEERAAYEAGLREIQQGESFPGTIEALRALRTELGRLRAEHAELAAKREALDRQIAALEARLSKRAKELLGVEE